MKRLIRPMWTEFWKIQDNSTVDQAAFRFFGYKEQNGTSSPQPHTADAFVKQLGVDLREFIGSWVEVGATDAPAGPVTPASERLPIGPIAAIRMAHSGRFRVEPIYAVEGVFNRDGVRAWVPTEYYERILDDNFFEQIIKTAEQIEKN